MYTLVVLNINQINLSLEVDRHFKEEYVVSCNKPVEVSTSRETCPEQESFIALLPAAYLVICSKKSMSSSRSIDNLSRSKNLKTKLVKKEHQYRSIESILCLLETCVLLF